MLTKRIIPCLDVNEGRVVKGTSFTNLQDAGDPVELASYYYEQGADEIVFLDIGATPGERDTMVDVVENVSKKVFIPLTVGGGLRDIKDIRRILNAGADKISINTAAVFNPEIIEEGAKRFGSQCIVLAIDARRDDGSGKEEWRVYTHGGKNPTDINALEWAKRAVELGCGEILLTSWDTDGHRSGYDLQLLSAISESVAVPVIASGGAGEPHHLFEALIVGHADAVLAASIFHYHINTIREVKSYLKENGIPIRYDY